MEMFIRNPFESSEKYRKIISRENKKKKKGKKV